MEDNTGFMQGDSLGLSQGQGRGLAQVFDSTYNPVFKEDLIRNIKSDKEDKKAINSQLAEISKNTVWSRDQPLLQEKMNDLYSFTQNNYRNIAKGNSQEALEYKQKIMDVANFAKASKVAENYFVKLSTTFSSDSSKFDEDETKNLLSGFYTEPGNFNIDQLQLIPKLDKTTHLGKMSGLVQKLKMDIETQPGYKDANGNTIYTKVEETIQENIDALAEESFRDDKRIQKAFGSLENYKEKLRPFGKYDKSQVIKGEPGGSGFKVDEFKPEIKEDVEYDFSTPVGADAGDGKVKTAYTPDKTLFRKRAGGNFTINEKIPPSKMLSIGAIPINVKGNYQAKVFEKDGEKKYSVSDSYHKGNLFEAKSQTAVGFQPQAIVSAPVFLVDEITDPKTGRKIRTKNIVLSKEDIKKGEFRGVKLTDDIVGYKPYLEGIYDLEVGAKQKNVSVLVPYESVRELMENKHSFMKELSIFEEAVKKQGSDLLENVSFTTGSKRKTGVTNKTNIRIPTFEQVKQTVEATKEWQDRVKEAKKKNQKLEYTKAMYDNFVKTNYNNK